MTADIVGFVGFTRQENDLLDPKEAATITEYLRSMYESGALGLATLSADLSAHVNDYDDPHRTAQSPVFLASVESLLYQYYCDISDETPMAQDAFSEMLKSPLLLEFARRLIVDQSIFDKITSDNETLTLPTTEDNLYADPNATAQTSTAKLYPDIVSFLKALGGLTGWNSFAKGNTISTGANYVRPYIYGRIGLVPIISKSKNVNKLNSLEDLPIDTADLPITICARMGHGTTTPNAPVDIVSIVFGSETYTVQWDQSANTVTVNNSSNTAAAALTVPVSTGTFWLEFDQTGIFLAAYDGTTYNRTSYTFASGETLGAPSVFNVLQPLMGRPQDVTLFSVALFAGVIDSDLIGLQTEYL